jgi:DNA-directed RNA polymerase subunit M/transcription elongation factor TFIIS
MLYDKIIKRAVQDHANPKAYKTCKECKNNIVKQVQIGENMTLINVCTNCESKWIE